MRIAIAKERAPSLAFFVKALSSRAPVLQLAPYWTTMEPRVREAWRSVCIATAPLAVGAATEVIL